MDYGSELANIIVAFSILGIMLLGLVWVAISLRKSGDL